MSSGKYLVISREGGDFSMDLIWAGLIRNNSTDDVIDFPPRAKFRQGRPRLVGDAEKDYGSERHSLGYVQGCETKLQFLRYQTIALAMAGAFKYVFMDESPENLELYLEIFSMVPKSRLPKVVIIAGHDRFRGDPQAILNLWGDQLVAMFIDDWQLEYDSLPKTHLINLSSNFDHLWEVNRRSEFLVDKKYDICFVGYNSHPVRKQVIDQIHNRWGHLDNFIIFEERHDEFSAFIRHKELFEAMARSRICINLPGASTGGRALRFYEIPYVGSYMLSLKFQAKLLHPFIDGEHCNYFENDFGLDHLIEEAFTRPKEREQIAAQGHAHAMRYHTIDARINYVLGVLGE